MISRCNKFVKSSTGPWRILQGPALTMKGNMKEILYKGKKVKVPFEDANYSLDGEKDVTIENRFGGEKATVPVPTAIRASPLGPALTTEGKISKGNKPQASSSKQACHLSWDNVG